MSLADTLSSDYDIGEFLHLLVERCSEVLQVTAVGVLLEGPQGHLELAAATTWRQCITPRDAYERPVPVRSVSA